MEFASALRLDAEDEVLPEALETHDGAYVRIGMIGVVLGAAIPMFQLAGFSKGPLSAHLLASAAAVLGVSLVGVVAHLIDRLRDPSMAARRLAVGLRPPRWWAVWWPRRYRRPGDIWDRLATEVRWIRGISFGVLVIGLPLQLAGLVWVLAGDNAQRLALATINNRTVVQAITVGALALFMGNLAGMWLLLRRWRLRRGFSAGEIRSLPPLPNADSRWKLPRYARLLEDAASLDVTAPSTDALVASLRSAGVPLPEGLTTALAAVRAAEESLDRELGGLREMVNAEETVKLDRRIAAVGNGDPQLRALLESQRVLLVRAEARISELGAVRERLSAQQQVLRQQLIALRDLAPTGSDVSEITGRIRAVNEDLRRLSEGLSEV